MERQTRELPLHQKITDCYFCYYSVYGPTIVNHLPTLDLQQKLISPLLKFNHYPIESIAQTISQSLSRVINKPAAVIENAFIEAFNQFESKIRQWKTKAEPILKKPSDSIKILLLGRPYHVFDAALNQGIPAKFEKEGYDVLHQSMLPIAFYDDHKKKDAVHDPFFNSIHWYFAQQILLSIQWIKEHPEIYPVFMTCFRCSPDSYVMTYFKKMMHDLDRPYLIIQLDEHKNDTGYQTRVEAGLHAFLNDYKEKKAGHDIEFSFPQPQKFKFKKQDTIYSIAWNPIYNVLEQKVFELHGFKSRIMPFNNRILTKAYRYVSGEECMPNVAVLGSILEVLETEKPDLETSIFYIANVCVPCNFPQFANLIRIVTEELGYGPLRLHVPNITMMDPKLPLASSVDQSAITLISSLLQKLYFQIKPYEVEKGATDKALSESIDLIARGIDNGLSFFAVPRIGIEYLMMLLYMKIAPDDPQKIEKETKRRYRILRGLKRLSHPSKHLIEVLHQVRQCFEDVKTQKVAKPKIAILGDYFVKFNTFLNDDIYSLVEELGGQIMVASLSEYSSYLFHYDIDKLNCKDQLLKELLLFEKGFESVFEGLLDQQFEPDVAECIQLTRDYGIEHMIPGEAEVNFGRFLYWAKHGMVDMVINLNPLFCCPGVVSASIFRGMQKKLGIPIIDLFYDGIHNPNRIIRPHIYYLNQKYAKNNAKTLKARYQAR